jgi:hypothetical protein
MIAVVGQRNVSLKRALMEGCGFPDLRSVRDVGRVGLVVNCGLKSDTLSTRLREARYSGDVLNRRLIISKIQQLSEFARNDVPVPASIRGESIGNTRDYGDEIERGLWVVKPINSQGGAGVRVWNGERISTTTEYIQKRVEKFREFRVHVAKFLRASDRAFSIQEKKPKPELHSGAWPIRSPEERRRLPFTWNINSGFYYRRSTTMENRADKRRRTPLFGRIEDIGKKALAALGYDFGAVDVAMDSDRNLYVLEVNSHPALKNDRSKEVYVTAFGSLEAATPRRETRARETSYSERVFTSRT